MVSTQLLVWLHFHPSIWPHVRTTATYSFLRPVVCHPLYFFVVSIHWFSCPLCPPNTTRLHVLQAEPSPAKPRYEPRNQERGAFVLVCHFQIFGLVCDSSRVVCGGKIARAEPAVSFLYTKLVFIMAFRTTKKELFQHFQHRIFAQCNDVSKFRSVLIKQSYIMLLL